MPDNKVSKFFKELHKKQLEKKKGKKRPFEVLSNMSSEEKKRLQKGLRTLKALTTAKKRKKVDVKMPNGNSAKLD